MIMNNISFKSTIKPITKEQFNKIVLNYGLKNSVDYPWTVKETIISKNAYTEGVYDCTVCGIKDGINIILMHICPTRKENYFFSKIAIILP